MYKGLGVLGALLIAFGFAWAQVVPQPGPPTPIACAFNTSPVTLTSGQAGWVQCTSDGKLQVNATVSASVTGFAPNGNYATLTATGSSASVALPSGTDVVFHNEGTTAVSCVLGVGSATATASKILIEASSWKQMTVGSNTFGACIDQTGSASNLVVLYGGAGLATGSGGGSSSGGGGGAITAASGSYASGALSSGSIASGAVASGAVASGAYASGALSAGSVVDGAIVTQGTTTDAACAGDATSGCTELARLSRIAARLSTLITNLGTANVNGIKTPGNSSPVVQAGLGYETIAASQTGQALGATGATGDYLSHCVVYPTTTTPGVVTVFDSTSSATNNVIAFPGGASSVSNLVPVSIPVGAFSLNGAWKVTTGANLVVTCYGNFTP